MSKRIIFLQAFILFYAIVSYKIINNVLIVSVVFVAQNKKFRDFLLPLNYHLLIMNLVNSKMVKHCIMFRDHGSEESLQAGRAIRNSESTPL